MEQSDFSCIRERAFERKELEIWGRYPHPDKRALGDLGVEGEAPGHQ